jgi:arginase
VVDIAVPHSDSKKGHAELARLAASTMAVLDAETTGSIKYHAELVRQSSAAAKALKAENPTKVFTAGGDCASDLAVLSYIQHQYQDNLCIALIDAHADLNTPRASPSGHFHGMWLRALLGDAPIGLGAPFGVSVSPNQLVMAGTRDLDDSERNFINKHDITCFSPELLRKNTSCVSDSLAATGKTKIHIHLDLDVLDPVAFPHVSAKAKGGLQPEELLALLRSISQMPIELVGLTVAEFTPQGENSDVTQAAELISSLLGAEGLDLASA